MSTRTSIQIVMASVSCLTAVSLPAQMSGTYTINPSGSGARNFTTFAAATTQLTSKGVSSPVVFDVAAGTYAEGAFVGAVVGTSSTSTVTFRSPAALAARIDVTSKVGFSTWLFKGIVIDGFAFYSTNSQQRQAVYLRGDDFEVRNCTFRSCYLEARARRGNIHHNRFFGRIGRAIQYLDFADGAEVHHNEIQMEHATGALELNPRRPIAERNRVYNNLFWGTLVYNVSRPVAYVVDGTDFVHNTIVILKDTIPASASSRAIDTLAISPLPTVKNNIIVDLNGGLLISVSGGAMSSTDIGPNLYYAPNSLNLFWNAATNSHYTSLTAWQQATKTDKNSFIADPQFVSIATATLDLRLRDNSPAIGKALGTPSFVTDDLVGTKRHVPASLGTYEGRPRAVFTTFGKGCPGLLANVPVIGYGGSLTLGTTNFSVTLSNALGGSGVNAFFALGASDKLWNGVPLPLNVGGSCNLLVSADIVLLVGVHGTSGPGNGTASVKMPIPSDPKLRGAKAYFQWGVVDPAAAGIGVAFSNAATLTL